MQWRNTESRFGWVAIGLHWLTALAVLGLFGLGLWMVELSYYDDWYRQAPALHKSVGILLFAGLVLRLIWRGLNPAPAPRGKAWERRSAAVVHRLMLAGLLLLMVAGYLISTADGRPIAVFGVFEVPATLHGIDGQEDWAGWFHRWLAYGLMALVALHAGAALKHQFIDRDGTLRRMLRP
jgi:cytochrome b561